ncbi:hypothetical protein Dimus_011158, partial [Dionaea muscipula]
MHQIDPVIPNAINGPGDSSRNSRNGVATRQSTRRGQKEGLSNVAPGAILGKKAGKKAYNAKKKVLVRAAATNLVRLENEASISSAISHQQELGEAKKCWEIGKDLGLVSNLEDEEVVSKLMTFEDLKARS